MPDLLNVVPTAFFEVVTLRLRNFFRGMRVHLEREQGEAPDGNPSGRGRWGWACAQMWHPSLYCRNELLLVNPFHEQASARFHWHSHCTLAWTGTAHVITTWPGRLAWSHTMRGKKTKKGRKEMPHQVLNPELLVQSLVIHSLLLVSLLWECESRGVLIPSKSLNTGYIDRFPRRKPITCSFPGSNWVCSDLWYWIYGQSSASITSCTYSALWSATPEDFFNANGLPFSIWWEVPL